MALYRQLPAGLTEQRGPKENSLPGLELTATELTAEYHTPGPRGEEFFYFSFRDFGPLSKNSGTNTKSFF